MRATNCELSAAPCPCARDVLASLANESGIRQSVLTGNLREVARIKLEVFDLDGYLDLASGAYGDDDSDRPKLVSLAQRRAGERTGVVFGSDATVLVGDRAVAKKGLIFFPPDKKVLAAVRQALAGQAGDRV